MSELKIISWNVNGIRTHIKNKDVNPVLEKEADIILFQETKTSYEKMDKKFLDKCDYEYYFLKGESARTGGLATFSKEKPKIVKRFFKESGDALGRASLLDYGDFTLIHVYAPVGTGNKAKLQEKLDYFKNLLYFAQKNKDQDLIITGDFNIAHKEADISDLNTKVTFTDEEREVLDALESFGFVDAFRLSNSEEKQFTSWKNQEAREMNEGARLDYFFVSKSLADKIGSCTILDEIDGSKHAPIELILDL
ncbi:MAG: exodeoxyribonuclease III [Methanobrevibacter olleyae]|uniref:Exodeoxyribonuclease III n=1 Tax=Methanobrevibacter olleyae TaxID=294671 RepID=A0A8T3VX47_METOL|nr:exodeoxyribonuclease III [Methanobrevibacter olleyae]